MREVADEEAHGTMETVDLADIGAVHQRIEDLQRQCGHARRRQCMAEMGQASDPGLMTHNLRETCEEAVDRRRRTSEGGLALKGEIPVLMKLRGRREDLVGTRGGIEIGGWSLIQETEVIDETAEREEMAVEAEENAEEVAMKAKESAALPITRGHGDDLLKQLISWRYVTSPQGIIHSDGLISFLSTLGRFRTAIPLLQQYPGGEEGPG